ncbi:hypothetical protein N656DRAFT_145485 [Canariomyces notabilis]|uniref:Uncharacterized protein n=1 Tax=Canariomyces notabilis TaxID=2074819 RepID=A0AAN6YQS1_9PEZI|nr:hypothetical protein N656DRAFT_145485 [Canariomyces arenarius]
MLLTCVGRGTSPSTMCGREIWWYPLEGKSLVTEGNRPLGQGFPTATGTYSVFTRVRYIPDRFISISTDTPLAPLGFSSMDGFQIGAYDCRSRDPAREGRDLGKRDEPIVSNLHVRVGGASLKFRRDAHRLLSGLGDRHAFCGMSCVSRDIKIVDYSAALPGLDTTDQSIMCIHDTPQIYPGGLTTGVPHAQPNLDHPLGNIEESIQWPATDHKRHRLSGLESDREGVLLRPRT